MIEGGPVRSRRVAKVSPWSDFVELVARISGEDFSLCYQCGNCTAGCPVAFAMDIPPHQVVRLLQLGQEERLRQATTMWLCLSCLQCYSRCPKGVDISRIMEALRQVSLRRGEDPVEVRRLPVEMVAQAPQQALVAGFRKLVEQKKVDPETTVIPLTGFGLKSLAKYFELVKTIKHCQP